MNVKITFLGAAESVTGSRYLLDIGDFRILFDCGLFQGLKELRLRNWDRFPVDPSSIDVVIISHAHIDHSGYLPRLVKDGFKGKIYCTEPTEDLMKIMLLDSAKLQEEEAAFAKRKGYSKHADPQPLYDSDNAKEVFPLVESVPFDQRVNLHKGVEIIYRRAGHLLGAAITELFIQGDRTKKKIVFSGDLGRYHDALMMEPAVIQEADVLLIESTYGNRDNPYSDPAPEIARVVNETFFNKGILLIPAFAVGRAQELLYFLHKLMSENKIPNVPVYIDSPMAISATHLYAKYKSYQRVELDAIDMAREMETDMLIFVKSVAHSKTLNELKTGAIIISSSGMMAGGRILHHLYNRLRNKQDTLLISGYQAEGTRGRKILDGSRTIRMFGEEVPVNCKVENLTSLSGHADKEELFRWMKNFKAPPSITFTVHGEGTSIETYSNAIRERMKWNVVQPKYRESVMLFKDM